MLESRTPAHVTYALIAVSIPTAFPILVAVIVAYVNRPQTPDPLLHAHYTWQIRTFWINLLWWMIGLLLSIILMGALVLFLNQLYLSYRLILGWYRLSQERYPTPV